MTRLLGSDSLPYPKTFVIEVTRNCNHQCPHCYAFWDSLSTVDKRPSDAAPMTVDEIDDMVARLQAETNLETIALSGGEPLLRPELPEIVARLNRRGVSIVLITNGRLLTPEKIDQLAGVDLFEVTLFSYRKEIHDQLAGVSGAWDGAVGAMANLRVKRREFVSVFVATGVNSPDLPKTAELSIALGAYGLMYNRVNLGVANREFALRSRLTVPMIAENLRTLDALAESVGFPVAVSVVIEPCVLDVSEFRNVRFGWCPLAGQDSYFTIDPVGNLRICNHSPTVLGNLRDVSFADVYRNHHKVREFREVWPIECQDCEPERKKICGGGCKAAAEQCYGTIARVDPFVTSSRIDN